MVVLQTLSRRYSTGRNRLANPPPDHLPTKYRALSTLDGLSPHGEHHEIAQAARESPWRPRVGGDPRSLSRLWLLSIRPVFLFFPIADESEPVTFCATSVEYFKTGPRLS
jgi:hypothetical protein